MAVAASLALLVVSSVIAFRGWPHDLSGSAPLAASPLAASRPLSDVRTPRALPAVALPPPARAVARRGRAVTTPSTHPLGSRTGPRPQGAPTGSEPVSPPASAPAPPAGDGSPSTPRAPVGPTEQAVSGASDAVRQTTQAAAGVVAPVAPSVAGALTQIGAAGSAAVDGAGRTVDGAVKILHP